ncbi:pseudaminic acid synthase [Ramlibacter tataouinensis]|uniref:pseudaminic acid synthase n=1 Tax=Ramlibacter tataouinensis TaxID=94132 RepID=UPI0022F385F9|nr:pseudaminic acid synthase [Ramlibacter tataouinensis]WBY00900.1 pseudaminic acid synthase [Ramlibacter tataouinensis]
MKIGHLEVGRHARPFVIAEMSGNHNQSLERALSIVDAAAGAGAHAIKLQTFTADAMTLDLNEGEFFISDPASPWRGSSLHALYQQAQTPWDWHAPIMKRARERGMLCFSTPFDEAGVEFLEDLDVPAYKIASFENIHLPLIAKAAATGKPLIISTGMASTAELAEAVAAARDCGCRDLVLLKCTSTYPASPEDSNIRTIGHLRDLFDCEVGLSDHTMGTGVAVASVALGATVIEKHFTLARADGGVDSTFSLEPSEFRALVEETGRAWQALGTIRYGPVEQESASLAYRRSVYIARDVRAGETFSPENLRIIRPGAGLAPKYWHLVLGRKATRDARKGTPLSWDLVG